MCGIVGIFEYRSGAAVEHGLVRRMNDSITHRGPDDAGYLFHGAVGLGMRRLSVIDLAGGHQPIGNEAGDVQVVFNGEIYNFASLRRELEEDGHVFRTHSDTEVIVHAYEEWGDACVARFEGMFAFALLDRRRSAHGDRLLIARDHLGKKPLYYADVDGTLVFGSELKPLLLHPKVRRTLDPEALGHYLALRMIPAPLSVFREVKKLPPGHTLSVSRAGVTLRRYWDWRSYADDEMPPFDELVADVRRMIFSAVERRLVADVPLGAFLSGGLDSSAVVAVMSRLMPGRVKTFSIGFEGPASHNELPKARRMAEHLGTDHHELFAQPDLVELLPEFVRYADEPFAISSALPTLLLARAARKEVTVVLTGDGGDEVFGGYAQYLFERWASVLRMSPSGLDPAAIRAASAVYGQLGERGAGFRRIARFLQAARRPTAGGRRLAWANAPDDGEVRAMLSPELREGHRSTAARLDDEIDAGLRRLAPEAITNAFDVLLYLPDEMLAKVDRMTMAASLEARSPLLDLALVQRLAGVAFARKVPGLGRSSLKQVLRAAVGDLLPPEGRDAPKWGFNVPLDPWFRGKARSYLLEHLSPERVARRGVFDPAAVRDVLARFDAGRADANTHVFPLLVFELWAEQYLDH
nr:asparagine synthase (glutamine-hydrolyzing) [Deltaproteobacteria bacterium]